jgi:glycosyltransferase involved in cell wall biosynthesis
MNRAYLVLSDFSGGVGNTEKIRRHFNPLAEQAEITVVCIEPDEDTSAISYRTAPSIGPRPLSLILLFVIAFIESVKNDYDGVLSISLVPYGCFALTIGRFHGLPVHLGIIGADLDVHTHTWYGGIIKMLLGQFDAISVPGTTHRRQLRRIGIPSERIVILTNGIDTETYGPADGVSAEYDCVWVGRFTSEKDPLLFVEVVAELSRRGEQPRTVMLGSGPLLSDVRERMIAHGLGNQIGLPGWVDEPIE